MPAWVLAVFLSLAEASEAPPPPAPVMSVDDEWARVYVAARRTSAVGAAAPALVVGGIIGGALISRASNCQEMGCLMGPLVLGGIPAVAGPLVLAGGSSRACTALRHLRLDVSCTAGHAAWVVAPALFVLAAIAPSGGTGTVPNVLAIGALPAAWLTGMVQLVLNERAWQSLPMRVVVVPDVRKEHVGLVWAVAI